MDACGVVVRAAFPWRPGVDSRETDPAIAQSLMLWDSRILAAKDLEERVETGMPPAVAAACVWGRRDAVMTLMQRIGALGGDWTACGELPGMLGPVPIAQPDTVAPGSSKPRTTG